LVQFRGLDHRQYLPGADACPDIHEALMEVPIHAGIERGLLDGLDVAWQDKRHGSGRTLRTDHGHRYTALVDLVLARRQPRLLLEARHDPQRQEPPHDEQTQEHHLALPTPPLRLPFCSSIIDGRLMLGNLHLPLPQATDAWSGSRGCGWFRWSTATGWEGGRRRNRL